MKYKKQLGVSTVDMLLFLALSAILSPMVLDLFSNYTDQKLAIEYADQTKGYAKSFMKMIKNNYATYYGYAADHNSNLQVIKFSDLEAGGYLPVGYTNKNIFGQTPCVVMQFNRHIKQLQALMFYVEDKPSNIKKTVAGKAAMAAGGEYGISQPDGSVVGGGKGWQLGSELLLSSSAACDFRKLPKYSLVANLSMLADYPDNLEATEYLSREKDNVVNAGEALNANTMQTDIIMSIGDKSKGIFFQGTDKDGVMLAAGHSTSLPRHLRKHEKEKAIVLGNGELIANSLQVSGKMDSYEPCTSKELGRMMLQNDKSALIKAQLQCTHNPLQCGAGEYCYLPIYNVSTRYHPNTDSFTCPKGYIDSSIPADVTETDPPPKFSGYHWECWAWFWGCINWQWMARQECSWAHPRNKLEYIDAVSNRGYTLYKGVRAITTWEQNSNGFDCNYNGQSNQTPGKLLTVTCTTSNPVIDYKEP